MRTRLLAAVLVSSSVLVASNAFAQGDPAAPAPAAPAPAAAPAAPGAAAPGAANNEDKPKNLSDEEADAKGRLWIGFNGGGGVGTGSNLSGPLFNFAFRAGYVFNSNMAVYGNLTLMAWVAGAANSSAGGSSVDLKAVGGELITPMFAYSPADIFELAAGPSLDHLAGGGASTSTTTANGGTATASVSGFDKFYFGAEVRAALHLGGRNAESRRRRGFTLSVDAHPSFVDGGPVTFLSLGLGADWF